MMQATLQMFRGYFFKKEQIKWTYRKNSKKEVSFDALDSGIDSLDREPNLQVEQTKALEDKLQMEKIEEKLMGLKDEYREIIILRYIDDLSINEIAQIVDKKKGAVRVILFRALNALRELMAVEKLFRLLC